MSPPNTMISEARNHQTATFGPLIGAGRPWASTCAVMRLLSWSRGRGDVLRQPVLVPARDAVLVGAAMHRRHGRAPVEVRRRRGRAPLEGIGVPGVAWRPGPGDQGPDHVRDEGDLRDQEAEGSPGGEDVQ